MPSSAFRCLAASGAVTCGSASAGDCRPQSRRSPGRGSRCSRRCAARPGPGVAAPWVSALTSSCRRCARASKRSSAAAAAAALRGRQARRERAGLLMRRGTSRAVSCAALAASVSAARALQHRGGVAHQAREARIVRERGAGIARRGVLECLLALLEARQRLRRPRPRRLGIERQAVERIAPARAGRWRCATAAA